MDDLRRAAHLVEALRARAAATPDREALLFVGDPDDDASVRTLTYAGLDAEARRIGSFLAARCTPGERILLPFASATSFAASFFGCLYAGAVAVPVPVPGQYRHQRQRLRSIVKNAGIRTVLTDTESFPEVRDWATEQLGTADPVVVAEDRELGDADTWTLPEIGGGTVALLQYTSGSTSEPKGVMVSHANLQDNIANLQGAFALDPSTRYGGWIPVYHDMGLMGLLLPGILLGNSAVLMSPTAFIRRPHQWLRLIHRYDIGFSAAPNFAYELCVNRITDAQTAGIDLSRWRFACSGSEPVRAATLRGFAERFAGIGLREDAVIACYGLAEATVFVSGTGPHRAPVTRVDTHRLEKHVFHPVGPDAPGRDLVGCGAVQGLDLRVVDPESGRVRAPGEVGELWLRGPSVSSGYWQNEVATAAAFHGRTDDGETGFLRTGDLGTVHDGELYVTGRIKETLVLRGRNLYPQDIEYELRLQHPELQGGVGAAFTVPLADGSGEALVVTHEIRARRDTDLVALTRAMRRTVSTEFGVHAAALLLLRPGVVRRTTSGKIQRAAMRGLFLDGELEPLHAHRDQDLLSTGAEDEAGAA
ncbi:fatty acyl-AMP ligase [Streptomyces parvus]|uniref:fatty acyl-AMP ligase n=1 Tax=Streptomyces parvus TaxID=66428 RepID=UPI0035E3A123